MRELYELKEKLMEALEDYGKKDLSSNNIGIIKDLSKSAYYVCELINKEEEGYSNEYSRRGRRRDAMGRYSSRGYSRDHGDMMGDY